MKKEKKLVVLVLADDRVIAATLSTVLRADGYMVATAESDAAAGRLAARLVIDAAVIDIAAHRPVNLQSAATLQSRYRGCLIVLVCSPAQRDEAVLLAEEAGLDCEFALRPISRGELLSHLAAAPGVQSNSLTSVKQLYAA